MTKEKFLYELVDNYLLLVSLGCMAIENYSLEDRTIDYKNCADNLDKCLEYYDWLYEGLNREDYSDHEVDANLNWMVQKLKSSTLHSIEKGLKKCIQPYYSDVDSLIKERLLYDNEGMPRNISADTLQDFLKILRINENNNVKGGENHGENDGCGITGN